MAAMTKFTGSANDNPVEILPLMRTKALRIARYPPDLSVPDIINAKLLTMRALAIMNEYRRAPVTENRKR